MKRFMVLGAFFVGCAHATLTQPPARQAAAAPAPAPVPVPAPAAVVPPAVPAPVAATSPATPPDAASPDDEDQGDDEATDDEATDEGNATEGEVVDDGEPGEQAGPPDGGNGIRYTSDIDDTTLESDWKQHPDALGSISFGFVDEGRLVNGKQFPGGEGWKVVSPERAWGTSETIDYLLAAIHDVRQRHPEAPPLRVNQISAREGGFLRPHKSHQNGRDADLAFFYPGPEPIRTRAREKVIDVPLTWALLQAVITKTDVQFVLVDRHVQTVLYDEAVREGADRGWLDSIFRGPHPLVQHARRHRDHFHVRFFNPRAQELGRRLAPLLAERPEQNLRMHKVRSGDTLGAIARRYGSSVQAIEKANHMRTSFLHLAQVLRVPLRGPCTQCPVPPPVVLPPRRLPPSLETRAAAP